MKVRKGEVRYEPCFLKLIYFFETKFLCVTLACPVTHSVDQGGLELTEICLLSLLPHLALTA